MVTNLRKKVGIGQLHSLFVSLLHIGSYVAILWLEMEKMK